MEFVVKFNNVGVLLLDGGALLEALDAFKAAVHLLRDVVSPVVRNRETFCSSIAVSLDEQRTLHGLHINLLQTVNSMQRRANPDDESTSSAAGICFVSKTPISLPGIHTARASECIRHWDCSVVLFNMALSMHLIGLRHGPPSYLHRALSIYNLCEELLAKHQQLVSRSASPCQLSADNLRLTLSLVNNSAHCCHELGGFNESRSRFQLLTHMMQAATSMHKDSMLVGFEGLLLNAIILKNPTQAAAA